jgi:hypothetical protein
MSGPVLLADALTAVLTALEDTELARRTQATVEGDEP